MKTADQPITHLRLIQPHAGRLAARADSSAMPALAEVGPPPVLELNRILVPLDFSETSLQALRYATLLARQCGASLCLLHVVEKTFLVRSLSNPVGGSVRADLAALGRRLLTNLRHRELGPDFPGKTLVRTGEPARTIAQAARELGIDLIIMFTPDRSRLRRLLCGSMAERVTQAACCPVLMVGEKMRTSSPQAQGDSTRAWRTQILAPADRDAFMPRSREFWYRLATNRYVFWGLLILAASLGFGAVTREPEILWRSAAALGASTVIIGLIHAWLDARPNNVGSRSHRQRRSKKQ